MLNLSLPPYEIFVEKIKQGNFSQFMCAYSKKEEEPNGILVFGSAVEKHLKKAKERAFYEFLERLALVSKVSNAKKIKPLSPSWRFSISNGVAAHSSLGLAKKSAFFELCERHAILSSWFGGRAPLIHKNLKQTDALKKMSAHYDFVHVQFPWAKKDIFVTACFGFPKNQKKNVTIYGFGCRDSLQESFIKAEQEAIQRLCFLWDQEPATDIIVPPYTAEYHQEIFIRPENEYLLKKWITGEFAERRKLTKMEEKPFAQVTYEDLSPSSWGKNHIKVVRASSKQCIPLIFGDYNQSPYLKIFGEMPAELQIHPVC